MARPQRSRPRGVSPVLSTPRAPRKLPVKTRKHRKQSQDSTDSILESISDGVFTVDADWHITSFNRAAEEITGIPRR